MPKQSQYLEVAVPTPLRRSFTYLPPANSAGPRLAPGTRLRVPFGRRSLVGILLGYSATADVEAGRIKPALRVLDPDPALPPTLVKLCAWAAEYYHHPVGEVFATALPVLLRQAEPLEADQEVLRATDKAKAGQAELARAPRQAALLAKLIEEPAGLARADLAREEMGPHLVKSLTNKGLAAWHRVPAVRPGDHAPHQLQVNDGGIEPTAEQQLAIETIGSGGAQTTLLYGITGSGKTEVYLRLIRSVLEAGKQALVLVPEIGLTPQTVQRFSERFNVPVAVLHSGLTDRERLDAWRAARRGGAGIVIGTRSAVFTPLLRPGLIVVDEEHDASFKQQDGFRYHARDLAVMRGRLEQVPVVLGSATPSMESWHNARSGKYRLAYLAARPGRAGTASYRVINIRGRILSDGFAPELLEAIGAHLGQGNQALVFLNRRGYSPVLLCRHCGHIAHCQRCDARMTLHADMGMLICHHCGSQARVQRRCPQCDSEDLVPLGAGTQRIEAALEATFPAYPVLRIDRDSTRRKKSMDTFMSRVASGEPCILVGTQLLAKGHHFPNVTLVAIVDMDGGFYSADYKATERMAQLILQVGGRAGRAEKPGIVAIQTHFPEQEIFRNLINEGYDAFADKLLTERQLHELPPFHFQALIRADATSQNLPLEFLDDVAQHTAPPPSVMLLGPVPSTMERRAGRYRAQLLLSGDNRNALKTAIDACINAGEESALGRKVRWSVDVDPVDLF